MMNKIKDVLRKLVGYNDLLKEYNDQYTRILYLEDTIENYEELLKDLTTKIGDLESKYEESKAKISELLHKETVDILELKSWYENRRRQTTWKYNGVRLGYEDVTKYLEVKDKKGFTELAKEIIKDYDLTKESTPSEIVSQVYRYWNKRSSWTYATDMQVHGKIEYWDEASEALKTRRNDCFTGDTKIIVKNNITHSIENVSFDELKNKWWMYQALSYDVKNKKSVWKPITKFYEQGIKPVYKVKPRRGTSFKCTDTHKFLYANKSIIGNTKLEWKELKDLDLSKSSTRRTCSIKGTPDTLNFDIDNARCNLIGSYVADGWMHKSKVCIAGDDPDRQELLRKHLDVLGIEYSQSKRKIHAYTTIYVSKDKSLKKFFESMGSKGEFKKFPNFVMSANNETKKLILFYYGQRDGTKKDGKVSVYSTISDTLQEQIKLLLTNLGIHYSYWLQIQDDRTDANRKPCHRIRVSNGYDVANNLDTNSIMHKEYVGEEETYDIEVADTHCFVLSDNNLVVHNCETKSFCMYWTIDEALRILNKSEHDWRLTFVASIVAGEGGHGYLTWLHDDGEYYVVESTYYSVSNYHKTWLKTPMKNNNMYQDPWGFANKYRSWKASNNSLLSFRDIEVKT